MIKPYKEYFYTDLAQLHDIKRELARALFLSKRWSNQAVNNTVGKERSLSENFLLRSWQTREWQDRQRNDGRLLGPTWDVTVWIYSMQVNQPPGILILSAHSNREKASSKEKTQHTVQLWASNTADLINCSMWNTSYPLGASFLTN